jgi:branched-subunit amino acid transport protein
MSGVSWELVLLLGLGAFACKVVGLVVIGARTLPERVERCLALIPAALITALIVKDTLSVGQDLVLDARAIGVGAAAVAAWRKLPLAAVIVIGAGVTAAARAVG